MQDADTLATTATWRFLETPPTRASLLAASELLWQHHDVWQQADKDVLERGKQVLAGFQSLLAGDTNSSSDEMLIKAYVRSLITYGRHLLATDRYTDATGYLEEALQQLHSEPALAKDRLAYYVRMPLCICWYVAGRYRDVINLTDEALLLVRHYGDTLYEARLLNTRGLAQRVLGDYQQALTNLRTSHGLYLQLEHPEAVRPIANFASLFDHLGQHERALRYFEEALAYANQYGYSDSAALTVTQLGDVHLESGNLTQALDYYRQAIPALEHTGNMVILTVALANAALVYSQQNQLDRAQDLLTRAQDLISTYPHKRYKMVVYYSLGILQHAQGELAQSQATLEDALAQAVKIEEQRFQVDIHQALSDVYEGQGKVACALYHQRHYALKNNRLAEQKRQRNVAGLLLDIALERQEYAREKAEYALKMQTDLLERITDGFLAVDADGIITYANHVIETMMGYAEGKLVGSYVRDYFPHLADFAHQAQEDAINQDAINQNAINQDAINQDAINQDAINQDAINQDAINQNAITTLEFFSEAQQRWFGMRVYPSRDGATVYLLDITERKTLDNEREQLLHNLHEAQAQTAAKVVQLEHLHAELEDKNRVLEQLSRQDGLTQLFNRRTLDSLFMQALSRAQRHQTPLCLALCDIDNFKQVNDQLSHAIGDETLKRVAEILSQHTRAEDIVARYGGEEFVVVVPETTLAAAVKVCDKIRLIVETYPWHTVHPQLQVTLSIGLISCQPKYDLTYDLTASAAHHYADYSAMLSAADAQMYRAKRSGKNKVCYPNAETKNHTEEI